MHISISQGSTVTIIGRGGEMRNHFIYSGFHVPELLKSVHF